MKQKTPKEELLEKVAEPLRILKEAAAKDGYKFTVTYYNDSESFTV